MAPDWKTRARAVGELPAYVVMRSAFVVYSIFLLSKIPYRAPSAFFSLPPLPLFDFPWFHSLAFVVALKSLNLASLALLIAGKRVRLSAPVAGLTQILLYVMYPSMVFEFNYFGPLLFFGFAIAEGERKRKDIPPETILAFFTVLLYLAAGLQKLTHLELMHHWLAYDITAFARPEFLNYCPAAYCGWTEVLPYVAISIELSLAVLFAFRRTRAVGVVVSAAFHTGMYTEIDLLNVGVLVMLSHCCTALLASGCTFGDTLRDRRVRYIVAGAGFAWLLFAALSRMPGHEAALASRVMFCAFALWPLAALAFLSFQEQTPAPAPALRPYFRLSHAGFLAILLIFVLGPTYEGFHKTPMLGWAMFSTAYFQNSFKSVRLRRAECRMPAFRPVVNKFSEGDYDMYVSFDRDLVSRFAALARAKCPNAKIPPIHTHTAVPISGEYRALATISSSDE